MIGFVPQLLLQPQYILPGGYLELKRVNGVPFVVPAFKVTLVNITERKYILNTSLHESTKTPFRQSLAATHRTHIITISLIVVVHVAVIKVYVQRVACIIGIRSSRPIITANITFLSTQFTAPFTRDPAATEAFFQGYHRLTSHAFRHLKKRRGPDRRPVTYAHSRF